MYVQDMNTYGIDSGTVSFCIPVRMDSEERRANLQAVVRYLAALQCPVIVLEADAEPQASEICKGSNIEYHFVRDTSNVFHRTHYINQLIEMAHTDTVAIWDSDVLVDYRQIHSALQLIDNGATISYPYDGRFVMLPEQLSKQTRRKLDFDYLQNLKMKSFLGRKLCGGAYIVHKRRYLQCGGENERFTGWGPEDAERLHRVTILGHKVCHIHSGELFHLYHPRGVNSNYQSADDARTLREEFVRVCCMSPDELKTYISK
ncbi:hypothetical protein CIL02_03220 [Prevotella sp. P3-122]|nr:hypothetical protein CIL02_03220 [Prevotella sp. P3-122]